MLLRPILLLTPGHRSPREWEILSTATAPHLWQNHNGGEVLLAREWLLCDSFLLSWMFSCLLMESTTGVHFELSHFSFFSLSLPATVCLQELQWSTPFSRVEITCWEFPSLPLACDLRCLKKGEVGSVFFFLGQWLLSWNS